ncbi:unnamed protein product [Mycena citricolor]|uniref:Uncharacterized protein n=1 Tax=Mycena citricolor TaxID=2018698 RepID=A0AAD2K0T5_9AGAR|nr:unnamed protein product [Mycena citricolor]
MKHPSDKVVDAFVGTVGLEQRQEDSGSATNVGNGPDSPASCATIHRPIAKRPAKNPYKDQIEKLARER